MNKINYFDNTTNWVGYFILHALDHTKLKDNPLDGKSLNVELKVNGIEFDFVSVVEHLGSQFENSVKEKAKILMKEKLHDDVFRGLDEIGNLTETLNRELDNKISKLFND